MFTRVHLPSPPCTRSDLLSGPFFGVLDSFSQQGRRPFLRGGLVGGREDARKELYFFLGGGRGRRGNCFLSLH